MADWEEVVQLVERLGSVTEELAVRGLRSAGPAQLSALEFLREELVRINAEHLAQGVDSLIRSVRSDELQAATSLLRLRTSLRLFERILTKEVVSSALEASLAEDCGGGL